MKSKKQIIHISRWSTSLHVAYNIVCRGCGVTLSWFFQCPPITQLDRTKVHSSKISIFQTLHWKTRCVLQSSMKSPYLNKIISSVNFTQWISVDLDIPKRLTQHKIYPPSTKFTRKCNWWPPLLQSVVLWYRSAKKSFHLW